MAGKKNMATTHKTARTASSHPIRLKIIEVSQDDYNARILTILMTLGHCPDVCVNVSDYALWSQQIFAFTSRTVLQVGRIAVDSHS
jgi:hypothetical protein